MGKSSDSHRDFATCKHEVASIEYVYTMARPTSIFKIPFLKSLVLHCAQFIRGRDGESKGDRLQ